MGTTVCSSCGARLQYKEENAPHPVQDCPKCKMPIGGIAVQEQRTRLGEIATAAYKKRFEVSDIISVEWKVNPSDVEFSPPADTCVCLQALGHRAVTVVGKGMHETLIRLLHYLHGDDMPPIGSLGGQMNWIPDGQVIKDVSEPKTDVKAKVVGRIMTQEEMAEEILGHRPDEPRPQSKMMQHPVNNIEFAWNVEGDVLMGEEGGSWMVKMTRDALERMIAKGLQTLHLMDEELRKEE